VRDGERDGVGSGGVEAYPFRCGRLGLSARGHGAADVRQLATVREGADAEEYLEALLAAGGGGGRCRRLIVEQAGDGGGFEFSGGEGRGGRPRAPRRIPADGGRRDGGRTDRCIHPSQSQKVELKRSRFLLLPNAAHLYSLSLMDRAGPFIILWATLKKLLLSPAPATASTTAVTTSS
jgi:hypothetical protein